MYKRGDCFFVCVGALVDERRSNMSVKHGHSYVVAMHSIDPDLFRKQYIYSTHTNIYIYVLLYRIKKRCIYMESTVMYK